MEGYEGIIWVDRKSGSAGMPRPISYAVFCLKKTDRHRHPPPPTPAPFHRPHPPPRPAALRQHRVRGGAAGAGPGTAVCVGGYVLGFFFNDTATTEIYPLSLHDALPISIPMTSATSPRSSRGPLGQQLLSGPATRRKIGRAVQQECRDRYRMASSGWGKDGASVGGGSHRGGRGGGGVGARARLPRG